jgi:hypothetical protein
MPLLHRDEGIWAKSELGHRLKGSQRSAVGTVIADRPPPKSVQAEFPHTAPALGA